MTRELERRDFLKGATLVGAAALGASMVGCAPQSKSSRRGVSSGGAASGGTGGVDPNSVDWAAEADVVVIGSGSSGTCSAIEAANAGSDVIILEKSDVLFGGNSALCGGYMLAAGWSTQKEMTGYDDSPEKFADQMVRWSQGWGDPEMIREAAMKSGEAVDWMMSTGREYEGASIIPPVWACGDTPEDAVPRSIYNHSAYGATEGHMATLKAMVDQMSNVEVRMAAEAAHLIQDTEGAVVGVTLADGSNIKARKGVVLACASVDNNVQMAKDLGLLQQVWGQSLADAGLQNPGNPDADTNTGDGVRMLREIGADLMLGQGCCMNDQMYVGGISDWGMSPALGREINMYESTNSTGLILVDRTGHRFCQDDAEWGYIVAQAAKAAWRSGFNPEQPETGYIYYICDSKNFDFMAARGHTPEENPFGTTYTADTIEGLEEFIGCPKGALVAEVERWNSFVESGVDLDFGRLADMDTISEPPFYADVMIPGPMGTFAGAKTTINTEVLGINGEIIPRLYAAGAIAGGMWTGPFYPGCGWAITNTVVWGRKAGQNVAALEPWS